MEHTQVALRYRELLRKARDATDAATLKAARREMADLYVTSSRQEQNAMQEMQSAFDATRGIC